MTAKSRSALPALPAEALLTAGIRCALGVGSAANLTEAAQGISDWPAWLENAEANGLLPLMAGCVDSFEIPIPANVRRGLDKALLENAKRVLIFSDELVRILREFDAAGVPALSVKGPVSAWTLYRDPAYREFSDLDLMVPPARVGEARRILSRCGYEPSGPPEIAVAREAALSRMNALNYEHPTSGIHVDLHWQLTPPGWFVSMPPNLWQRTRQVSVNGHAVTTLSEEDTFLHLCFHGAKHGWSNLNWLVDVASLIMRSPGIGGRSLQLVEPESKAAAMVQFVLAAASVVAPDAVQLRDGRPAVPERIEAIAQATVRAAMRGEATATLLDRCRFQWNLGGSRLAMARYVVRWLFTPDQTDWASMPIQRRALLFLLVPWRLWRLTLRAAAGAT